MFNRYAATYYLYFIIAFSVMVKLAIFLFLYHLKASFTLPDSPSYLDPASTLINNHFSLLTHGLWERTPGYPLIIAGIYKLFGSHHEAIILVQVVLSGLLIYNAYRITALLSNTTAGVFAAAIVAIDYLLISYSILIMTDLLFAIIFSYVFYYGCLTLKESLRPNLLLLTGFFLALSTLIRPVSYYLIPVLALSLFIYSMKIQNKLIALRNSLLFLLPCILLVGSWQYRNKQIYGTYQLTNIDAVNLYHYYAADVLAHVQHQPISHVQKQLAVKAEQRKFDTPVERYNYYRHEGAKILLSHPVLSIEQGLAGLLRTLFGNDYILLYYNQSQFLHGKQLEQDLYHYNLSEFFYNASITDLFKMLMVAAFFLFNALLVLTTFYYIGYGLYRRPQQRQYMFLLLIIIGYFCVVSSNYCSLARFRMPFQIIIDSCGVLGLLQLRHLIHILRCRLFSKNNILAS